MVMSIRRKTRLPLVLALTLTIFCGLATPKGPEASPTPLAVNLAAGGVDEQRAAARDDLVKELELLAEWCKSKKVFACRAEVYNIMLHFDAENDMAKRGLGFKKQRDGSWKLDKRRKDPKNYNKDAAEEFPAKRSTLTQTYKNRMLALLGSAEDLGPRDREAILSDVLFADPDDSRVHEMRGEVKLDDRWVLGQSAAAKKHRAELKEMVRIAFGTLPKAKEAQPSARESAFGIEWKGVFASPIARSLSTGSKSEAERLTEAMWATRSYFNRALSAQGSLPKNLTVYTFGSEDDRLSFLEKHPDIDEAYRQYLMPFDGSGIRGTDDFAYWAPEPTRRLDGLVRQAIAWMFAGSYNIFPKQGWIFEGFGLYMTRELVGTRLTWFVRPSEYLVKSEDDAFRARLLDTRTNWMSEAKKVLQNEKRPKLQFLLGKDVNQLTTEDLLYSYALSAYLIEAEGEKLPGILKRIGSGTASVVVLESELGIDLQAIDARLRRWLEERI
jgi:hypothetical protein